MNQDAEALTWGDVIPLGWSSPTRYGVVHLIVTKPGDPYDRVRAGCSDTRPTGGQLNLRITGNVCRACAQHPLLKTAFADLERPRCQQRCRPNPNDRSSTVQCTLKLHHAEAHEAHAYLDGILAKVEWTVAEKKEKRRAQS